MKTGYKYTRESHILCRVTGKWGGAKHLREWETHGGNADITRVTKYADQNTHKDPIKCDLNGSRLQDSN